MPIEKLSCEKALKKKARRNIRASGRKRMCVAGVSGVRGGREAWRGILANCMAGSGRAHPSKWLRITCHPINKLCGGVTGGVVMTSTPPYSALVSCAVAWQCVWRAVRPLAAAFA